MKAKILELIGKYYGTQVEIDFEDGLEPLIIKIWERGDKPSDRQLSKNVDYFESNHYENDASYNRAMHLVAAVLSLNIIKDGLSMEIRGGSGGRGGCEPEKEKQNIQVPSKWELRKMGIKV